LDKIKKNYSPTTPYLNFQSFHTWKNRPTDIYTHIPFGQFESGRMWKRTKSRIEFYKCTGGKESIEVRERRYKTGLEIVQVPDAKLSSIFWI
jgi:hypothetical protein